MPDPLIDAIESLPPGSQAPQIIAAIYSMPDMTLDGKRALASMFLAAYRVFADEFKKEANNG